LYSSSCIGDLETKISHKSAVEDSNPLMVLSHATSPRH
jgi:hypothetical protein